MKNALIALLLLFFATGKSQQIFTLYDCTTKAELYAVLEPPQSGCFTIVKRTGNYAKPVFNTVTQQWVNNATASEQKAYEHDQLKMKYSGVMYDYNDQLLDSTTTSTLLDDLYPDVALEFWVQTPTRDYKKTPSGWSYTVRNVLTQ